MENIRSFVENIFTVEAVKKNLLRYLIEKHVGQFLDQDLSLEQLTLELTKGTGTLRDINLAVDTLNELSEQYQLPINFVDGYISELTLSVPWNFILKENVFIEINGLMVTVKPKQRVEDSKLGNLVDSVCSMSSSIVHDVVEDIETYPEISGSQKQTRENMEVLVSVIENVFARVKVRFLNTTIRIEHVSKGSKSGIAAELRVKKVDYFDEAGVESKDEASRINDKHMSSTKKFHIEGVEIFTDEFSQVKTSTSASDSPETSDFNQFKVPSNDDFKTPETSPADVKEFNFSVNKPEEKDPDPILFAKLNGRVEVKVKMKQSDNTNDPKLDVDINIGSLFSYSTPRQISTLLELVESFTSQDYEAETLKATNPNQKPMDPEDFKKVEKQLQRQLDVPEHIPYLHNGWSAPQLDDSEENFVPMHYLSKDNDCFSNMTSSNLSTCSDLSTSFNSSSYSSQIRPSVSNISAMRYTGAGVVGQNISDYAPRKIEHRNSKHKDSLEMTSRYKLKLGTFLIVLTHEDILTPSSDNDLPTLNSINVLLAKSDNFFKKINGFGLKNFKQTKEKLSEICSMSHICIAGFPLGIDYKEKGILKYKEYSAQVQIGSFEIHECLIDSDFIPFKREYTELLYFEDDRTNNSMIMRPNPNFKLNILKTEKLTSSNQMKKVDALSVKVTLDKCVSEIDISMFDRLNTLFREKKKEQPSSSSPNNFSNQACFNQTIRDATQKTETKTDISVCTASLSFKLRFPIPDLRPLSDLDRLPWWKKNLRKDIMTVTFQDLEFVTLFDQCHNSSFEIRSEDIHIQFQEKEEDKPMSLLRTYSDIGSEKGFDIPRIVIVMNPVQSWTSLEDHPPNEEDLMTKSVMGFLDDFNSSEPGLFDKRKLCTESETMNDLIIPSNRNEIQEFISKTEKNSKIQVNICLPELQIIIPSKHIMEVISNRLTTDLLLWESAAPKSFCKGNNLDGVLGKKDYTQEGFGDYDKFSVPNQAVNSDDEDDERYFSTYDDKFKSKSATESKVQKEANGLSLSLSIGKGSASLLTPYKDTKKVISPDFNAEFLLEIEQGNIFVTTGYEGDENQIYSSILAQKVCLHHRSPVSTRDEPRTLDPNKPLSSFGLDPIFYPSDDGVITKLGCFSSHNTTETFDMLTLVLKTDFDVKENVKTIVLAGGLKGMTLRLSMVPSPVSWVNEIYDLFDIQYYPVQGYTLPNVVTEINFNLWNCGIDYQPLNIPLKTFVTIDTFSIATVLSESSSAMTLRLILEDSALFLSKKLGVSKVDLKKNYVCVVDLSLLEISARTRSDESDNFNLTVSNNVINVRTCADSFQALADLIVYLSSDGDMIKEVTENLDFNNEESLPLSSSKLDVKLNKQEENCVDNEDSFVSDLIDDAMQELIHAEPVLNRNQTNLNHNGNLTVFTFPGENLRSAPVLTNDSGREIKMKFNTKDDNVEMISESPPDATKTALDEALDDVDYCEIRGGLSADDEFCILGDEVGTGIKSPMCDPDINVLHHGHIIIKENHFAAPREKYNQLKTNNLLTAISNTFLKFSINLILYDGNDFENSTDRKNDKSSPAKLHKVAFEDKISNKDINSCNKQSSSSKIHKESSKSKSYNERLWQAVGGPGRDLDSHIVVKLKKCEAQHRQYPNTERTSSKASPISRSLTILVNEIEILDMVKNSTIHKILYLHATEECPRQSHASMVSVKAIFEKPDGPTEQEEACIKLSLLPIKVNMNQNNLEFGIKFFNEVFTLSSNSDDILVPEERPASLKTRSSVQSPILTVNRNIVSEGNLEHKVGENNTKEFYATDDKQNGDSTLFIKSFIFNPEFKMIFDYQGQYALDAGLPLDSFLRFLIAFGQLRNSEIVLKRIFHKSGLLGISKLIDFAQNEWKKDIINNQIPSVLSGLGPMHSIVDLYSGVKDLFWLPVEQYQKDGRMIRGLQRGTSSFSTASCRAALDLTGRFVGCIQSTAETMHDMVSYGPSARNRHGRSKTRRNPQDIRAGVTDAFQLIQDGIGQSANTAAISIEKERKEKGMTGMVGEFIRQIAPNAVQPVILMSEATGTILDSVKNQLVPDARKEAAEKWKS